MQGSGSAQPQQRRKSQSGFVPAQPQPQSQPLPLPLSQSQQFSAFGTTVAPRASGGGGSFFQLPSNDVILARAAGVNAGGSGSRHSSASHAYRMSAGSGGAALSSASTRVAVAATFVALQKQYAGAAARERKQLSEQLTQHRTAV